jgi:23S rRNA (pseudouridine1915-N3)-methyltransferase
MFKVKIYTVGKCKETWLQEALAEYEKRLSRTMEIEWILSKNNAELIEKLPRDARWISLDVKGELLDSPALSKKLLKNSRLHFLIGGPDGIDPELLAKSAWRWSLSPLTFTHQIVRLLLVEQLYRALEIDAGTSYHR